jgi:hypothetical protein
MEEPFPEERLFSFRAPAVTDESQARLEAFSDGVAIMDSI